MLGNKKGVEFTVSDYFSDEEDLNDIIMSDFEDSFNLMIGTTNKEIDWFDNPYMSV